MKCEVCGNSNLESVLDLGMHPMCDDLIPVGINKVCNKYKIEILYCKKCNTAHQKYQIPKAELFPKSYHYRSRFTQDVLLGMKMLVDKTTEFKSNLTDQVVLDIGCNDGSLLGFYRELGAITVGIEPTNAINDATERVDYLYQEYFDVHVANKFLKIHGHPDVIVFTNVFAHIEDLDSLLGALKILINENTLVIIENHYLGAIIQKFQFDTFYHEHPRSYSANSFNFIAKRLDLNILDIEFPSRYGGNIRVVMGCQNPKKEHNQKISMIFENESNFHDQLNSMQYQIDHWIKKTGKLIKSYVKNYGPLRAKAFPGRAAILVECLGLNNSMISCVYEKPGSLKIGSYLPGTRIPIVSDDDLVTTDSSPIINLAWHISSEIKEYLRGINFSGEIIDIIE